MVGVDERRDVPVLRERLKTAIRQRPAGRLVPAAAELFGARRLADRLDRVRSGGPVAAVRLPQATPGPRRVLSMFTCGDGDLCATAVGRGGWEAFERPMPDVFLGEARLARSWIVDVGANSGFYALVAKIANPRLPVATFEPLPSVAALLRRNLALNGVTGVEVHQAAVGESAGTASLYVPPEVFAGVVESSASLSPDFKDEIAEKIDVDVVTLDGWWAGHGRPAVSVLKIDVESREVDVLRGAREVIATERPLIFYELLPKGDADGIATFTTEQSLVDLRLRPDEAVVGEAPAFDPDAWNHLLVPVETVDAVLTRLAATLSIADRR